jgi:hypothetical protein
MGGIALGLSVEAQVHLKPTQFTGIGIYGFVNVNGNFSFGGILLSVQLGKLR